MATNPAHNKWKRHEDGLIHCSDQNPGCAYTHKRAASVGRHAMIHAAVRYARNSLKERRQRAKMTEAELLAEKRKRDRRYYHEHKAKINASRVQRDHAKKETRNVNGTNSHPPSLESEQTAYFLTGGWSKELQSAARTLNEPLGEFTERCIKILRATNVR